MRAPARSFALLALACVVATGIAAVSARAEDAADPTAARFTALEARVQELNVEVDKLRGRVETLESTGKSDPATERFVAVEARALSLKADVDLLRAREDALTAYLVALARASTALRTGIAQARTTGFEAAAIPQVSRTAVLAALETLARDLATGLPTLSPTHLELRRRAEELRRVWPR